MKRLFIWMIALWLATPALAADLNVAQLQALKSDINSNFLPEWNAQQIDAIVTAYNASASPTFTVWKQALLPEMYRDAITWTELTGRSAGERDMFAFLTAGGSLQIQCARTNVRQAIQDAFSGAGGVNTRTALLALCKRTVTRFERLFATGTGSDATPGQLVVEGPVAAQDVIAAMGQ